MSPLELVDDRFEKLSAELRASRPLAPAVLRERVASLRVAESPTPRRTYRFPSRRVVLGLAGAALVASFVVASVTGLDDSHQQSFSAQLAKPSVSTVEHGRVLRGANAQTFGPLAPTAKALSESALAPSSARLQRYQVTLGIRVKDVDALSDAARRAMSLTRAFGGYVASVQYATRGGERGGATLVLRVPVTKIQAALGEFTSLGTILRQQTGILDVTRRADREARQIARLERELETATPSEAAALERRLKALRAKHARLLRSAQLARISLSLTTPAKQAAAPPSRLDSTLDDAGAVLVRELEILLYALVVAGPLLLLGGALIAAGRAQRRRSDRRLLERA